MIEACEWSHVARLASLQVACECSEDRLIDRHLALGRLAIDGSMDLMLAFREIYNALSQSFHFGLE